MALPKFSSDVQHLRTSHRCGENLRGVGVFKCEQWSHTRHCFPCSSPCLFGDATTIDDTSLPATRHSNHRMQKIIDSQHLYSIALGIFSLSPSISCSSRWRTLPLQLPPSADATPHPWLTKLNFVDLTSHRSLEIVRGTTTSDALAGRRLNRDNECAAQRECLYSIEPHHKQRVSSIELQLF